MLIVNLAEQTPITGVRLSSGRFASFFARRIAIDLSANGADWTNIAEVDGGTATLEAALRDQKHVDVVIQFESHPARHVRIRQTGRSSDAWAVAELRVLASQP